MLSGGQRSQILRFQFYDHTSGYCRVVCRIQILSIYLQSREMRKCLFVFNAAVENELERIRTSILPGVAISLGIAVLHDKVRDRSRLRLLAAGAGACFLSVFGLRDFFCNYPCTPIMTERIARAGLLLTAAAAGPCLLSGVGAGRRLGLGPLAPVVTGSCVLNRGTGELDAAALAADDLVM